MKFSIFLLLFGLLFWSCAATQMGDNGLRDQERLKERVFDYWKAKQQEDLERVLTFVDPETKHLVKNQVLSAKRAPMPSEISGYRLEGVKIEGETATVTSIVDVKLPFESVRQSPVVHQKIVDTWVKREGIWYVNLVRPSFEELIKQYQREKGKPQ
jgi:hypothetical protein